MNNFKPSRGEVWFVNLDPTMGHEQAKTRPCLIISHDNFNHSPAHLHIVLPITSKDKHHPFHVPLEWLEGGSETKSFILCDQIRTISRQRLKSKSLGTVTLETLESIEYIMRLLLRL